MSIARRLVPVVLVGLVAVAAVAADEPSGQTPPPATFRGQPVAVESTGAPVGSAAVSDPAAGVPVIDVNRTEIDALRSGQLTLDKVAGNDAAPSADAARAARRAAFDAIVTTQQAKIRSLKDRLESASGNDDALEIQKEIEHEKLATQRQLLELQLAFATRDGDQARIDQVNAALATWDAPQPVLQPVDRPLPTNPGR